MNNKTAKSVKPDRNWTHLVYSASSKQLSRDRTCILSSLTDQLSGKMTIAIRVCKTSGPLPKDTLYIKAMTEEEILDECEGVVANLENGIKAILKDHGITLEAMIEGVGKFGKKLYSWEALQGITYETNDKGNRHRALLHVKHRHAEDHTLHFTGPWSASTDEEVIRKAMFAKWNKEMTGFTHINFNLSEQGFRQRLITNQEHAPEASDSLAL